MTRKEEIKCASKDYINYLLDKQEYHNENYTEYDIQQAFEKGAEWADNHPKSPWISVKDDLPCNYEELMSKYPLRFYKKQTVNVLTLLPNGSVATDSMGYRERWWNGGQWDGEKWEWDSLRRLTHWVPIPKLPKE